MALTQQSRIIVLHLTKYGDSGLVVHAIDSEAGRCSYMLRGAGRSGAAKAGSRSSRVTVGSFHNLAVLDIVSVANPRSSMALIKEYEPAIRLDSLRSDVDKNAIALFISELLYRTIVEQNYDPHLFAWLTDAIAKLDALGQAPAENDIGRSAMENALGQAAPEDAPGHVTPTATPGHVTPAIVPGQGAQTATPGQSAPAIANFHLWFLAGLCTVMGFGPSREGLFDGCDMFHAENLALLRQITAADFSEAMAIPLNGSRRRDFCDQMVRYISYHLGMNLNLRSLDVLHALYR